MKRIMSAGMLCLIMGCASASTKEEKKLTPEQASRAYVQIAVAALKEKDPVSGLEALSVAERHDEDNADVQHVRALIFNYQGEKEAAYKSAMKAVEMDPENPAYNTTLGKFIMDRGEYKRAEKHLTVAMNNRLFKQAYKPITALGIIRYRQKKIAKAKELFNRAIRMFPNQSCLAYYYMGNIQMSEKRFGKALGSYEKAADRFCAGFAQAHLAQAQVLIRSRNYEKARRKLIEINEQFKGTKTAARAMERLRELP